jgi:hypothetical protein
MKVKELIEKLKTLPPNFEIGICYATTVGVKAERSIMVFKDTMHNNAYISSFDMETMYKNVQRVVTDIGDFM